MKRPSFQFYPGDWLRDMALRSCSIGARGLWIDMICFMHEGEPYGYLKVGQKVILPANLARMVGENLPTVEGWLDELKNANVFDFEDGVIFSRRMVRDEEIRRKRATGGHLGGNPALVKNMEVNQEVIQKVNLPANLEPTLGATLGATLGITPSSSSSSSSLKPKTAVSNSHKDLTTVGENCPPSASFVPSAAGMACKAMSEAGICDINTGHPVLLELIEAGATTAEFKAAAHESVRRRKGFAYAIGMLTKQREDAAKLVLHQGRIPNKQETLEASNRAVGEEWARKMKEKLKQEQTS